MKPASYIARSPRLLKQLEEVALNKDYSLLTHWRGLPVQGESFCQLALAVGSLRIPRNMGATGIQQFLTMLIRSWTGVTWLPGCAGPGPG